MPPLYYAVREIAETPTIHSDRDCPDGPVRAAPTALDGEECPDCREDDGDREGTSTELTREDLIEDGTCPWCIESRADDPYEGEHIGQHASSAHPEAWSDYKDR